MDNTMIVATVTAFSGSTTPDKNGEGSVMLQCIAGTMPNRNVLSGTVAQRAGFEIGKTYLMMVRRSGFDDLFGDDYNFIKVMEITSPLELVKASKELGEAKIQFVARPEGFEDRYQRKSDAVEGRRAERIKAGLYHPSILTTISNHTTAANIKLGSSLFSGGKILKEAEPSGERIPGEQGEGKLGEDQGNQPEVVSRTGNKDQR